MRKIALSVLGLFLLLTCDNGGMENTNNFIDPVTITFETGGLVEVEPLIVERGTKISYIDLPIPIVDDHDFLWWCFDKRLEIELRYYGSSFFVEEDTILYGNFVNCAYKHEISNLTLAIIEEYEDMYMVLFSWDNPDDPDLSHVNFYTDKYNKKPFRQSETNTLQTGLGKGFFNEHAELMFKCVDIYGNLSKGIEILAEI